MNVRIYSFSRSALATIAIASLLLSLLPLSFASAQELPPETPLVIDIPIPCAPGFTGGFEPNCVPILPAPCPDGFVGIQPACTLLPPPPVVIPSAQCTIYSDTSVVSEQNTVTVTPHPLWIANFPKDLGDWIWSMPDADGIVTFTKTFNVDDVPTGATLKIAVDNSYTATLNGNPLSCDGSGTSNFNPGDTCSAPVVEGVNTLVIAATNAGGAATSIEAGNPAGLIFELVIDGSSCSPVPPPVVLGCTDPVALNYNEEATSGNEDAEVCEYEEEVPQCTNLLLNGSFEEPTVTANGGQWQIFQNVVNWAITLSDGLELWRGIIPAYDGKQSVELDGNAPTKITQPVVTIPGATYELSFAFAARADTDGASNNNVDATADGSLVVNAQGSNTNWTVYTGTFEATDSSTDIAFQDLGSADSVGSLIDDAHLCLVREPEVVEEEPESSSTGGGNGKRIELNDEPEERVEGDRDTREDEPEEENGGGRVLGEQTSVIPAGAPNTGAGGATNASLVGFFLLTTPRRNEIVR